MKNQWPLLVDLSWLGKKNLISIGAVEVVRSEYFSWVSDSVVKMRNIGNMPGIPQLIYKLQETG